MQNHGSYDKDSSGDFVPTVDLNYDKEYPLAETYFSAINVSDQELKRLLEYFKNLNETTMVVLSEIINLLLKMNFMRIIWKKGRKSNNRRIRKEIYDPIYNLV